MSYTGQDTLARDVAFIPKVRQSIVRAAIAINGENPATLHHIERANLAFQVLRNPDSFAPMFAQGVTADDTITGASSDAAIDGRVSAIWDDYSLAY